jgi:hypothetical protein
MRVACTSLRDYERSEYGALLILGAVSVITAEVYVSRVSYRSRLQDGLAPISNALHLSLHEQPTSRVRASFHCNMARCGQHSFHILQVSASMHDQGARYCHVFLIFPALHTNMKTDLQSSILHILLIIPNLALYSPKGWPK